MISKYNTGLIARELFVIKMTMTAILTIFTTSRLNIKLVTDPDYRRYSSLSEFRAKGCYGYNRECRDEIEFEGSYGK